MYGNLNDAIFLETIYAQWLDAYGAGSYRAISRADGDVQKAYRQHFKKTMRSALQKMEG